MGGDVLLASKWALAEDLLRLSAAAGRAVFVSMPSVVRYPLLVLIGATAVYLVVAWCRSGVRKRRELRKQGERGEAREDPETTPGPEKTSPGT
ncbi:hypothetical protein [Streptomyces laurentii]|uniref:hypothetical protein n=1 Tax=Streptomyces laurentii TaxID=39478 RepID=UPI0036D02E67